MLVKAYLDQYLINKTIFCFSYTITITHKTKIEKYPKLEQNTKLVIFVKNYMAKKSLIQRELKRQRLVMKYAQKRALLKQQISEATSLRDKLVLHRKLQQLPRNSSAVRLHNRCQITGRSRGYFRDFGLSRHVIRELAHQGLLPGVTKASW